MNAAGIFIAGAIVGVQVGLIIGAREAFVAWIIAGVIAVELAGVAWVWRQRE